MCNINNIKFNIIAKASCSDICQNFFNVVIFFRHLLIEMFPRSYLLVIGGYRIIIVPNIISCLRFRTKLCRNILIFQVLFMESNNLNYVSWCSNLILDLKN